MSLHRKKAMTKFKFYLQTSCGAKTTEFSVKITGIIIKCEDVTAYVGDEKNLACTVSSLNQNCYMIMYKFTDTAAAGDICKEQFSKDLSNQENRFSCPYTANKAMTKFKFYLQTSCGAKTTEFSLSTTDIIINCEDVTAYVGDKINLNCTVSYLNQICYMTMYKFTDTAADGGDICKEQFSKDLLNQERSFSCPHTTKKPMTKFKFYLQTTCGQRTSEFSLSTTDMIINCENVTAPVGAEINLACNVSHLNQICYTTKYKFTDTAAAGDDICKEQFSKDLSKQESRLSCPYTAKSTMTRKFKFYLQTTCGQRTTDFIVKITDIIINCEDVTAYVGDEINLACTVSHLNQICYMTMYKFTDTAAGDVICKEQFSKDLLNQERRVSCPYTTKKPMTKFKFYLQTTCGQRTSEFSLSTTDMIINCENVTAPVGAEINLACTVSHLNQICYTTKYKFTDTTAAGDDICKEQFSKDLSKQESRLSCPYTAKSTMTRKFKFYLQTTCGQRTTDFIVKITDIKINCEDVTARVGDEINLTCTVRYLNKRCCGMMYKFIDTAAADDPTICREDFRRDSCKQELRFSCTYTANKAMTTTLKFFLQSNCGSHTRSFTANIAGAVIDDKDEPPVQTTDKTTIAVVICLLSCFVIVIVALFLWKRRKTSRSPPDYDMGVSRPPQDYNMAACENNISEPSDEEAALKETSVNAQTVSM
ncbi:uncharacterized protein [Paramisgurnus dabryanus]|uniref:uncharacterized protein n=1 Tax=Paramisgurnus dabryanus TaxID=90735 RepID=UPI0031F3A132